MATTARARKLARIGIVATLAILALVTIAIPIAWGLMARAPSWWRAPDPASDAMSRGAEAVERAFSGELARHHEPGAPWSIDLTEDAANAWLNHRLPLWLDHEGIEIPWPVEAISARFGASEIRIGVERPKDRTPRIVGITVVPRVDAVTGALHATVRSLHLGALTIPGAMARRASGMILGLNPGSEIGQALGSGGILELRPIPVPDGPAVQLIGITLQDHRVRLTFRAAGPEASGGLP